MEKQELSTVDAYVGKRIKARRKILGMTQNDLAAHIGLTFQQIRKYETGENRVTAERLWSISTALGVRVDYFFQGYGDESEPLSDGMEEIDGEFLLAGAQLLRLIRRFRALEDPKKRAILNLIDTLSGDDCGCGSATGDQ